MEGAGALLSSPVVLLNGLSLPLHQDAESEPGPARAVESEGPCHFSCLFLAPVLAVWSRGKPNLMPFIGVCLGSNNEVKFDS